MICRYRFYVRIVAALVCSLFTFQLSLVSCNDLPRNRLHPEISDESIQRGEILAKSFCQSCHLFPEPALLDATTWEKGVLPHMGPRLGIFEYNYQRYPNNIND